MTNQVDKDPLPGVASALLNSADIQAYQDALKLVSGEVFDPQRLKAASYQILCKGTVYFSDENNRRMSQRIEDGADFTIPRNGLVFIAPDVKFQLPDFIAARFNLTIDLVHKGLLLGTGPLVDPGFAGQLLIPLHNLTDSPVKLQAKEGLIWVEFTKLSPIVPRSVGDRAFEFRHSFEGAVGDRPVQYYFDKTGGVPVRSTLFDHAKRWEKAVDELREVQRQASAQEEKLRKYIGYGLLLGIVAVVSLFASVWQTYASSIAVVKQAQESIDGSGKALTKLSEANRLAICDVLSRVDRLEKRNEQPALPTNQKKQAAGPGNTAAAVSADLDCGVKR